VRLAAGALVLLALSAPACGGEDAEPAADVGEINCSSTRLAVTLRVKASPDGVHLHVNVSQEHGVSVTVDEQPARGSVVMQLAPGDHRVRCSRGDGGSLESTFEVVEPET
jgi:hypothetical protein